MRHNLVHMEVLPAVRGEERLGQHPWSPISLFLVRYGFAQSLALPSAYHPPILQVMPNNFAICRDGLSIASSPRNTPRSRVSLGPSEYAFIRHLIISLLTCFRGRGLQRKMLFVHDPKAIHHIAVKEQDTFQEAEWFTRRVLSLFGVYEDDIFTCHPSPVWLSIQLALVFLLHKVPYRAQRWAPRTDCVVCVAQMSITGSNASFSTRSFPLTTCVT